MSDVNAIKSYLDFAGLSNLRAKAKDDQTSAAKEVGRQFEAMFVQMMMKSVRQANESIKSDLMDLQQLIHLKKCITTNYHK